MDKESSGTLRVLGPSETEAGGRQLPPVRRGPRPRPPKPPMTPDEVAALVRTRATVNVREASLITGLHPKSLRTAIAAGRLPAKRLSTRTTLIAIKDLLAFVGAR